MSNVQTVEREVISKSERTPISFHFQPSGIDDNQHIVVKSDKGMKRRYLCGISSGIQIDGHGERMTEKCIKSFMEQANRGDVLLYPDVHGIKASEDIGILTKAEIQPSGDWYTEYRLYDDQDGIGAIKLEKIDDLWKQLNGFAPYKKPRQMGFSIEGYIPESAIISANKDLQGNLTNRVIDDVVLDGTILVPRPAYKDSIATAVYKALGEIHPFKVQSIQTSVRQELSDLLKDEEMKNAYYRKKYEINDALDKTIEKIMMGHDANKQQALEIVFDEFKSIMIGLILESSSMFQEDIGDDYLIEKSENPYGIKGLQGNSPSKLDVLKSLRSSLLVMRKELVKKLNQGRTI